jgi:hypothetical protein
MDEKKIADAVAAAAKAALDLGYKIELFYHGNVCVRVGRADYIYDHHCEFKYRESEHERWSQIAASMGEYFAQGKGWFSGKSDDGEDSFNHWTGAKDALLSKTGWDWLPSEWCTILSVSLGFGPTPCWDDMTAAAIMSRVWPDGNQTGGSISPEGVVEKLLEMGMLRK